MSLQTITSEADLDFAGKTKAVLFFQASWHPGIPPLQAVISALASTKQEIFFGSVDAEAVEGLTAKYKVTSVPTLIFLNGETIHERLEGGVDAPKITQAVQRLAVAAAELSAPSNVSTETAAATTTTVSTSASLSPEEALNDRLHKLIRMDTVMLFMKGVPDAPRCGFSRQAVELLDEQKIPFGSFDILSDEEVRQGLKKYSNWPTFPQVYVKGELQGGLDILKELCEDEGENALKEAWELENALGDKPPKVQSLNDRLEALVKRSDIMLFMKGLPSNPQCGFSRQLVALLDQAGVSYDAYDILQDEEVRQGLKTFSNWPTFPQLYVKGDLIGGLDICNELEESGELLEALQQ